MRHRLVEYYARRAAEYERIYAKPERQNDLMLLRTLVAGELAGRRVVEIACGTGYWTAAFAPTARSVTATDLAPEPLAIARAKSYPGGRVRFARSDAWRPQDIEGTFDAMFAGFWWSHVPRAAVPGFLAAWHARLGAGSRMVFVDNRYVAGSSTPVARVDSAGDTWQRRRLDDGSEYEVVKNFPTAEELRAAPGPRVSAATLTELQYYWLFAYTVV